MPRTLPIVVRALGAPARLARRWRKTALVLAILVLGLASGAGVYGYALQQWRAAEVAIQQDRPRDALDRLEWCLRIWPRSPQVHFLAARAARISGDFKRAEHHLNQCLQLQHGATEAVQLEFLLMRVQNGEAEESAPVLLDYVQNSGETDNPEIPVILETLARYYIHNLQHKEAYACLSRWMEESPSAAKPYQWRGWVQERLNNPKRALEDYKRALELDPDLLLVRLRVAEMLMEDNDPLQARAHLEQLRLQHPDRADVMARLGQCRFLQGQHDDARRLLTAAVEQLPNDAPLLIHLAKLDLEEGWAVEAEQWLRRSLKADPFDSEAEYCLFLSLQRQGRQQEAAAALALQEKHKALVDRANHLLRDEVGRSTTDPNAPSQAGATLLEIGQDSSGLYWLHEALKRDPGHLPTHKVLAEYYERKADLDKAAQHRRWLGDPDRRAALP